MIFNYSRSTHDQRPAGNGILWMTSASAPVELQLFHLLIEPKSSTVYVQMVMLCFSMTIQFNADNR
uniref:Uncharacterized protein n=1 Tax=Romanomermis culicivorax TaxID=13658 RepID=A0A915I3H6_ROMCU